MDDLADMRRKTGTVVSEATKVGLRENIRKLDELMKLRTKNVSNVLIEDESIQVAKKFVYRGYEVQKDGDVQNEFGIRIGKAVALFRSK